jgi:hypothetical protein
MTDRICSILGETQIPSERRAAFREKLKEELRTALTVGYTWFQVPYHGDLGPLCVQVIAELRRENPERRITLDAVFPKGGDAAGGEMAGYDGVIYYNREQDREPDLAHYMVHEAERTIFVYFSDRHIQELVALNYAEMLRREVRLAIL